MKVSKLILEKIKTDRQVSLDLADILGVRELSILQLANRESSKLTLYAVVEYFKSKGFTEDEIFESKNENELEKI